MTKGVLFDLVQRTKTAVQKMDNLNFRRMQKMLMKGSHNETSDHPDGLTKGKGATAAGSSTENVADSSPGSPVDEPPSGGLMAQPVNGSGEESDSGESSISEFSQMEVGMKVVL